MEWDKYLMKDVEEHPRKLDGDRYDVTYKGFTEDNVIDRND